MESFKSNFDFSKIETLLFALDEELFVELLFDLLADVIYLSKSSILFCGVSFAIDKSLLAELLLLVDVAWLFPSVTPFNFLI